MPSEQALRCSLRRKELCQLLKIRSDGVAAAIVDTIAPPSHREACFIYYQLESPSQ
jgi:hypothetical protein